MYDGIELQRRKIILKVKINEKRFEKLYSSIDLHFIREEM